MKISEFIKLANKFGYKRCANGFDDLNNWFLDFYNGESDINIYRDFTNTYTIRSHSPLPDQLLLAVGRLAATDPEKR